MKKILLLFLLCPLFIQAKKLVHKTDLVEVNQYWKDKKLESGIYIEANNDKELIQTHLRLVERALRKTKTNLSNKQKENRNHCLNILHQYWEQSNFPQNTFHAKRTPYFIDIYGTYCAVGYLIKETGFEAVAQKIHQENNFDYIKKLQTIYPEINSWAQEFGFTLAELAWIQPSYSPTGTYQVDLNTVTYDSVFTIHPATCDGKNDGGVSLAYHPVPYTYIQVFSNTLLFPANMPYWYMPPTNNLSSGMPSDIFSIMAVDMNNDTSYINNFYIPNSTQIWGVAHVTNELCNQPCTGSIMIDSIQNAVAPITFALDGDSTTYQSLNMFTNLCQGTYYDVAIKDGNGCYGALTSPVIEINGPLSINKFISSPIKCFEQQAIVEITTHGGTQPYTGSGIFNLPAGNYTKVVTDAVGCTDSVSFSINSPSAIVATSNSIADHGIGDGEASINVSGGTPPYDYYWSNGTVNQTSIQNLSAGIYHCTITDSNSCQKIVTIQVNLEYPQTISANAKNTIEVFPNPSRDFIEIKYTKTGSPKKLYDAFGRLIIESTSNKLDVNNLSKGLYYLICDNQRIKIIVE